MVSYNPDKDIPDLSGKVILVTGGNIGLGYETVLQLAKHKPAHIYIGARSAEKASAAITQLQKDIGEDKVPKISHLQLDLASIESIKSAAQTFNAAEQKLDLLINNAGVFANAPGKTTDGYEVIFGTNHIGHALLIHLLLPTLERTADASLDADVRIITLASEAESVVPKGGLVLTDVHSDMASYSVWKRYGQSKLANILYSRALAQKYPKILTVSIHPGMVSTTMPNQLGQASFIWKPVSMLINFIGVPASKGAWGQLWAATAPRKLVKNGSYYVPFMKESPGSKNAQSTALRDQLWEWTQSEFASKGL